jgi:hypothetical protein
MEIMSYYNKFKQYLSAYKQVPNMVKEKVFEIIKQKKESMTSEK